MDGQEALGVDGATLVDGLADDIDDSAEGAGTDGNLNGIASVDDGLATHETLSGVESDGSDVVATQVLGDLEHESVLDTLDFKSVENWGQGALRLHVDDGTNNLRNLSVSNLSGEATCINDRWLDYLG